MCIVLHCYRRSPRCSFCIGGVLSEKLFGLFRLVRVNDVSVKLTFKEEGVYHLRDVLAVVDSNVVIARNPARTNLKLASFLIIGIFLAVDTVRNLHILFNVVIICNDLLDSIFKTHLYYLDVSYCNFFLNS